VVVVRDGPHGAEVLMVRRNREAVFLGGAHVFPGGAVDPVDHSDLARRAVTWSGPDDEFPWRAAALRELAEEAGIVVGPDFDLNGLQGEELYQEVIDRGASLEADALEYVSNWVTPPGPPRRFDTRFYVVAGDGSIVTDDREVFDAVWVRPEDALAAADRDEWFLEFPTRMTLASFLGHATAEDLLVQARRMPVRRVAPRIGFGSDGSHRILLEGDPGFDEAPA
jgi:8-oxo-dGTP pyrophosphatase MutT (NUDIX family)